MIKAIENFIAELDLKSFYRFIVIFFGVIFVIIGGLFFYSIRKTSTLERQLRRVNQQREEARSILQEHALVKEQQTQVDEILSRDKNFKIAQYFLSIVSEMGLNPMMSKEPVVSDQDLNNGYSETQLDGSFKNMDMKQIAELLYKIEQNNRVYTKELVVLKPPQSTRLDVTLIIATLQPKS